MSVTTIHHPQLPQRWSLKRLLIGSPLPTHEDSHQTVSKKVGLAVVALDALSRNRAALRSPAPPLRHTEMMLPRGSTILEEGDNILALVDDAAREELARLLGRPEEA